MAAKKSLRTIVWDGYSKYSIQEDGKVYPILETRPDGKLKLGKEVKPSADGNITITGDDGADGVFAVEDIKASFPPVEEVPPANPDEKGEKTEEEDEDPVRVEHKRLKKALADAQNQMLKSKDRKVAMEWFDKVESLEKELADFKEKNKEFLAKSGGKKEKAPAEPPSAEQIAAQEAYDAVKKRYDEVKAELDKATEELRKFKKVSRGGTGDPQSHVRHLTYEDAQEIRKMLSEGVSNKDIREKFENSDSSINYIRYYLQHKLKKGDPEYLPRVNKYYPPLGHPANITGTDGAPYQEDNVKESAETKYKVKDETIK